jgi:hypothetical protein
MTCFFVGPSAGIGANEVVFFNVVILQLLDRALQFLDPLGIGGSLRAEWMRWQQNDCSQAGADRA